MNISLQSQNTQARTADRDDSAAWRDAIGRELVENILPFWQERVFDPKGGFFGKIDCDGIVDRAAPRSVVLNTRILWTFAAAWRLLGEAHRRFAEHALAYVTRHFVDRDNGGLYWMLDAEGAVLDDRKQIYAQAFGIYALAEYNRAAKDRDSLALAQDLFRRIEAHSRDHADGGYIEARARDWSALADMRLSEKDLNAPKSMNTHLHVMEAYANLLRVWRDPALTEALTTLLTVVLERIFDAGSGHLRLFFDADWRSLSDHVSFGHDIETAWLIVEAAEVLGDPALIARAHQASRALARTAYDQGRDADGSLLYEVDAEGGLIDANKHWWAQAEAMVGFENAFRLSGDHDYRDAARRVWSYIETRLVDHVHGEWHAKLDRQGRPYRPEEDDDACLAGPWKCPYHNARACFEMLTRLG